MQFDALAALVAAYCHRPAIRHELGLEPGTELMATLLKATVDHLNWLVQASDGRRWVLRLSLGSPQGLSSSKQIAYEAHVLRMIEPLGMSPQVCFVDATLYRLPYGCLIREYLPGSPLDPGRPAHLRAAAASLARLHQLPTAAAGLTANARPLSTHLATATKLWQRYTQTAGADGAVAGLLRQALAVAERELGHEQRFQPTALTHGNPAPANWVIAPTPVSMFVGGLPMVGSGPKPRLADWPFPRLDDATADVGRLLLATLPVPPAATIDTQAQAVVLAAYLRDWAAPTAEQFRERVALRLRFMALETLCQWAATSSATPQTAAGEPSGVLGQPVQVTTTLVETWLSAWLADA